MALTGREGTNMLALIKRNFYFISTNHSGVICLSLEPLFPLCFISFLKSNSRLFQPADGLVADWWRVGSYRINDHMATFSRQVEDRA